MTRSLIRACLFPVTIAALSVHYAQAAPRTERPVASVPTASPATVSGSVGDWSYRCIYTAGSVSSAPNICTVEQRLFRQDADKKDLAMGGVILARATPDPVRQPLVSRPWRLTMMSPLGLSLVKPPRLVPDNTAPLMLAWQSCVATGCLSVIELTDQQARILRHGKEGHMQIDKLLDGVLTINFSLDGLDGALSAVEQLMARPSSH